MRELALDRRQVVVGCVAVVLLFAVGGKFLLGSHASAVPPPVRVAAPANTSAARATIFVNVVGAVHRPGLYRLREGSRVATAVSRAGGPTRRAQLELVNLAALVSDGEQIVVPRRGTGGTVVAPGGGAVASGPVHLNSATLEQLDALPGVGPVTAQKILSYRQEHGSFGSVDELDAVPGIGPARLEQLRELVAP